MQNEKCSNKTLRVCGAGGVRKNKGKWQAVLTVADEMTGKKVQRTRNTRVPCLKQSTRGKAAAMRVLAEFRSEVELELAEAEEARAAIGAGLPAEQRDDYAALPLSEALEKFIDFCLEMNRITPTTRDDYHYSALHIERDELGLVPVNEVTTDDVNAWSRRRIAPGHGAGHAQQVIQARQAALRRPAEAQQRHDREEPVRRRPRAQGHRQAQERAALRPRAEAQLGDLDDAGLDLQAGGRARPAHRDAHRRGLRPALV